MHRPALDEFNEWAKDNNAYRPDPIWSPTIYKAQKKRKY